MAALDTTWSVDWPINCAVPGMKKARQAAQDASRQLRLANEELTRAMMRTREAIELSPDAFFQADLDARFTDVNQAAWRMLGYDRDELIGKTIFEIIPVEDTSRLKAVRAELLVPGHVHRGEWTLKRKDGTFVPVDVSAKILPDGRWQAFVRDISERRRIERALQESEERFRLTVDEAPIGMALVALDGHFVRVNRALCEIIGYSSTELTELAFQDITHPDDLDVDVAARGQLARGDIHRYDREKRYVRKDGTTVDVLLSVSILRSRDGAPLYFISQIEDITERKRAEAALRRSEFQYRGLIEHMPDGVFAYRDGRIVYANDAFVRLLGYDAPSALVGKRVFELLHPDDHPALAERMRTLQQTGLPAPPREFRIIGRDGSLRSVETVGVLAEFEGQASIVVIARDLTVRKRAEEAVRAVSAELRQTLQTAATGLTHCSRDLRYLSANLAYAQWIGLPLDQIVRRPIVEVMGQAAFEIIRPRVERVLNGERVEFEDELPIAGELKSIHVTYTPDRDASGYVVGWVASITDITERKRIEQELRAANAFLDAIIENIPLVLFLKDAKSLRYLRLNRASEDLLGWPKETFIGKNDYDLWPRAQAQFFVEKDRETLKGKMIDVAEEPVQTHYQGVRLMHTKKVPILDTAGQPMYLLGISEDITERRRVEREQQFLAEVGVALSASLDYELTLATLARLVVQDIADWCAIDVTDERGQMTRLKVACADPAKAALCAILEQGPPDRDLPNLMRSVVESKRPIVVEQVTSRYIESFAQGPGHLHALLAAGVTSFVAVPMLMRGQPLGALFLGSSSLSRVYGQGDLRLAEALADRAATAIENARLYRSSVNAIHLRDQVLSVVAHDLRSPLSAILLQAAALRRSGPDPERRSQKQREAIHAAATRMNRLIQDLLDVALVEAGRLPIEPARLSARELIAGAVDMQRPLASSSSLELRSDLDRDVPDVWGDRDRLLQVFENLIGNAIKFTKPAGCITVSASSRDHDVVFRVADTGAGIAPEDLSRVFDRFWRATSANRQGAGLGLPITKGIVEAHGGRIWVESAPERGTTFSFTIPKATPEQGRPAEPSGSSLREGYRAA
jgi:PAS domain S-box-containing protein